MFHFFSYSNYLSLPRLFHIFFPFAEFYRTSEYGINARSLTRYRVSSRSLCLYFYFFRYWLHLKEYRVIFNLVNGRPLAVLYKRNDSSIPTTYIVLGRSRVSRRIASSISRLFATRSLYRRAGILTALVIINVRVYSFFFFFFQLFLTRYDNCLAQPTMDFSQ